MGNLGLLQLDLHTSNHRVYFFFASQMQVVLSSFHNHLFSADLRNIFI